MKHSLGFAVLMAVTAPMAATASEPWEGHYVSDGQVQECEAYGDHRVHYGQFEIEGHEFTCTIDSVTPLSVSSAWSMTTTCGAVGQIFPPTEQLVMLTDDGLAIYGPHVSASEPSLYNLHRCEAE